MEHCPHCGGTTGYFTKELVRYCYYFHFDGSADEYTNGISEMARVPRKNTIAYCTDCGKRIAVLKEMEQ